MTTLDGIATYGHLIDGAECRGASGRTFEVRNPANGALVARVPEGDATDVDRAIAAAQRAFADGRWSRMSVRDRARIINRFADAIEAALPDLATIESTCVGRPLREMRAQLGRVPEFYRYFAAVARTAEDAVTPFEGPYLNYVRRVPLGVVGQLTPWNHPLLIFSKKLAPALAAGNTVVVKPSEYTPLTTLIVARLALEAGVPDGVLNVVTGFGGEAGAALCTDKRVRKIDLTGGTETGRLVAKVAGENLVRVTCELGGKAPVIVLPDADLDRRPRARRSRRSSRRGRHASPGRACSCTSLTPTRSSNAWCGAPARSASAIRSTSRRSSGRSCRRASSSARNATSRSDGARARRSRAAGSVPAARS